MTPTCTGLRLDEGGRDSLTGTQAVTVALRNTYRWPKVLPSLTADQEAIRDDFMRYWHERLAANPGFGPLEWFNQGYAVWNRPQQFLTTLEIGAGLGEHLAYERLSDSQWKNYVALELRPNMLEAIAGRDPRVRCLLGDCQQRLDFPDGYFDRILAIHVLEHLPDLPAAVRELRRLCHPAGTLSVVIPCEGGLAYGLARRISAQRLFEQRYQQSYDWFIEQEHLSVPGEILAVLEGSFVVEKRTYFPLLIPSVQLNLCIGLTLHPR